MKTQLPILGESFPTETEAQSTQRLVNFYLEEDKTNNSIVAIGTPGLELWSNLSGNVVRSLTEYKGYGYAVVDSTVYKITDASTYTSIGTLTTLTGRVSVATTYNEIIFCDGAKTWVYSTSGGTFTEITDVDYPSSVSQVAAHSDYVLAVKPDSFTFYASGLRTPTSFTATSYAAKDIKSDNLAAMAVAGTYLWLIGKSSSEQWYNSGAQTISFDRVSGGLLNFGTNAPHSVLVIDGVLFWLAQNENGLVGVVSVSNEAAKVVSNRAMVHQIANYTDTSDAFAWSYQENGHSFYNITFPTAGVSDGFTYGKTWSLDVTTMLWSELESVTQSGPYPDFLNRHRANCHMYLNGEHLIGDYESGKIYKLTSDAYDEDSSPIIRKIISKHFSDLGKRLSIHTLEIECNNGNGLTSGQGSDPQIGLRHSKDRGRNWSSLISRPTGAVGETTRRTVFHRLGSGRYVTFELTMSDPVKWVILGATAHVDSSDG